MWFVGCNCQRNNQYRAAGKPFGKTGNIRLRCFPIKEKPNDEISKEKLILFEGHLSQLGNISVAVSAFHIVKK